MRRSMLCRAVAAALLVLAWSARPAIAGGAPADEKGKAGQKGQNEDKRKQPESQQGNRDEDDKTKPGGMKLPKAVAEAVESVFPGMKVLKAEKEDEDGDVVYEVTLRGKGGTLEAKLTPKGRVVEVELKGGEGDEKGKKGDDDDEKGKARSKKGELKKGDDDKGKKKRGEDDEKGKKRGERD